MLKCLNVKMLKCERGVSLYLALLVMAILLSIGLTLSAILIGQIRMIKGIGDSVIAFYAADTGIEKVLLNRASPSPLGPETLDNGAVYTVTVYSSGTGGCAADNYCIRSVGNFKGVRRAIEVEY